MFIYTFLTKQATFHISCHGLPEQQRWHESRREVRLSVLSDWLSYASSHASLFIEDWRVCAHWGLVYDCVHACTSIHNPPPEKHKTPSWVKMMHILISLIIHPCVTDERILVSVSGKGNMRGVGAWQRGGGRLQSPNDCVPAGAWTSPCAQRRARWDTHQDLPLWCGEELGKWTFSEYRIIRESSAPRHPSKVWIPQDSRDTLTGSQSLPFH